MVEPNWDSWWALGRPRLRDIIFHLKNCFVSTGMSIMIWTKNYFLIGFFIPKTILHTQNKNDNNFSRTFLGEKMGQIARKNVIIASTSGEVAFETKTKWIPPSYFRIASQPRQSWWMEKKRVEMALSKKGERPPANSDQNRPNLKKMW
jgi:hypothetical protein